MTYFGFLLQFLVIPIFVLAGIAWLDHRRGRKLPAALRGYPAWILIAAHMLIALIYTTPWDNYLVATRVWWYDPDLVAGIIIGYVPIEEYTFFLLQPILASLWLLMLARRLPQPAQPLSHPLRVRRFATLITGSIWLVFVILLLAGWQPATYLSLLLAWSLPPVIFQMGFGGDILWRQRRIILLTLIPATIYLSFADSLAITSGTWTIDPEQSLNLWLGGILPFEEAAFFFMTNLLIVLGMTLMLSRESQTRTPASVRRFFDRNGDAAADHA
jgi:lycopene cyclase domain-containing protein